MNKQIEIIRPVGPRWLEEFGWAWLWPLWIVVELIVFPLRLVSRYTVDRARFIVLASLLIPYIFAVEYMGYLFYTRWYNFVPTTSPILVIVLLSSFVISAIVQPLLPLIRFYKVLITHDGVQSWKTISRWSAEVVAPQTYFLFVVPIVVYELAVLFTVITTFLWG